MKSFIFALLFSFNAFAGLTTNPVTSTGTWTPVIAGTTVAGSGTYSAQVGVWVKVGPLVYYTFQVAWSAHTGTGNISITGLPFTSNSTGGNLQVGSTMFNLVTLTASNIGVIYVGPSSTTITVNQGPTGGGSLAAVAMDTSATIYGSGVYSQ